MKPTYDNALHLMEAIGGSFARALAELYYRADQNNKLRVRLAFPEIFARYESMYAEHLSHCEAVEEAQ
jgi:hypothetical protein